MARTDINIDMIPCDAEEAYISGVTIALLATGGYYATYGMGGEGPSDPMYVAICRTQFSKVEANEAWTVWAESQYQSEETDPKKRKEDLVRQVLDDFDGYPIPENWEFGET